jgi:hypothetical protein
MRAIGINFSDTKSSGILVIVEGNCGICVKKENGFLAQFIFPKEVVFEIDETELLSKLSISTTLYPKGLDKPEGDEPRNSFSRNRRFIFVENLRDLLSDTNWTALSAEQIRRGIEIPKQEGRVDSSWSCGPNSGARALQMLDRDVTNFDLFVSLCPTNWCFVTIGPTVGQLAQFLSTHKSSFTPSAVYEEKFEKTLESIKKSIASKTPTIILLVRSFANMHYVNVIGFNDAERRVGIMETNQYIYWMTYDDLKLWMSLEDHILLWFTDMDNFSNTFTK